MHIHDACTCGVVHVHVHVHVRCVLCRLWYAKYRILKYLKYLSTTEQVSDVVYITLIGEHYIIMPTSLRGWAAVYMVW